MNKKEKILLGTLVIEILFWIVVFFSKGELLGMYFHNFDRCSQMDFFQMLALMNESNPYVKYANYPALCFGFLKILNNFIPIQLRTIDGFGLKDLMSSQVVYMMYILIILIYLIGEVRVLFNKEREKNMATVVVLFSGPLLFALERGNLLLMAIPLLMTYLRLYDSEKKVNRYIAFVCLSVAAAIKIYPAIFGLFTVQKRKWKETIVLVFCGSIAFFLPFLFWGFKESFAGFLGGIFLSSGNQGNWGMGYSFSLKNLLKIIFVLVGSEVNISSNLKIMIIAFICTTVLFFIAKKKWEKIFALSLACIWAPEFSYTYSLLMLVILFLYMLNDVHEERNYVSIVLNMIIIVPIALPSLAQLDIQNAHMPLNWPTAIINVAILLLFVVTYVKCLKDRLLEKHKE